MSLNSQKKERMKSKVLICVPTPPPYAGPEVASGILLEELRRIGFPFKFIKANIKETNKDKGKFDFKGLIKFLSILISFINELNDSKVDRVYLLLSSSKIGFTRDSVYLFLSKLFGKKNIAHYRGGNFDNFYNNSSPLLQYFIRFTLKRIDKIIVQAGILKPMFDNIFDGKVYVLYNGIITGDKEEIKKETEIINILFLGHISFAKGFYDLIEAYKILNKEFPKIRLMFGGTIRFGIENLQSQKLFLSGETLNRYLNNYEHYEAIIQDFVLNAEKYNARYLGIIKDEEKVLILKESNIFVLPSYTEGFSFATLEAMNNGLAIVVTKVGAFPEIIKEGVNGYLVNTGDEKDLAEHLKILINDIRLLNKISLTNQSYVKNNFSIEVIAKQFIEIMED